MAVVIDLDIESLTGCDMLISTPKNSPHIFKTNSFIHRCALCLHMAKASLFSRAYSYLSVC